MTDHRSARPRWAVASCVVVVTAGLILGGTRSKLARVAIASIAGPVALASTLRPARRPSAPSAIPRPKWAGRDAIRARPRRADRLSDAGPPARHSGD